MDDGFVVTVYVVVAEKMATLGHRSHPLVVLAAKHFQHHHALALATLQRQSTCPPHSAHRASTGGCTR